MTDKELLQHAKEAIADLYRCVDRYELCVERGCEVCPMERTAEGCVWKYEGTDSV